MKIKLQVNRALIALDAFFRSFLKHNLKTGGARKTVIIVFQQVFGDAVAISDSLMEYVKLFPASRGYKVLFLVRPSVLAFMREVLPLPVEIQLESVDFKKYLEDFSYYREINSKYRGRTNTLIVPASTFSADVFTSASDASRKIGRVQSLRMFGSFVMAVFSKIAYTEQVRPKYDDMILQRHRMFLHYLGQKKYQARLPALLYKGKIIAEDHYCVICPGASTPVKCWPMERFAEIIDFIVEKYDVNVHLCGGSEEKERADGIPSLLKYPDRLISHVGKTSFSDWSAIVQHADLVVGNDSATIHLAAAARRKAICIVGVYDKYLFFPYKVDVLEPGDRLPVSIYKDMSCELCRTRGYFAGYGNTVCKKRIKQGKCASCIDAITVQEVKDAIQKIMSEP